MAKLHFTIVNLQNHLERTFDLWTIKKPDAPTRLIRSIIFMLALLGTIYLPLENLFITGLTLILLWIILALIKSKIPRYLLLLNIMVNIRFLFELTNYFLFFLAPEASSLT